MDNIDDRVYRHGPRYIYTGGRGTDQTEPGLNTK